MISTQEIGELVHNPDAIRMDQIDPMIELADKYPYTQLFSIILLNGLNKYSDVRFEELLTKHSFRIANRERLYHLIHDHELQFEHEKEDIPLHDKSIDHVELSDENGESVESPKHIEEIDIAKTKEDRLEETILHHALTSNYKLPELTEEEEQKLEQKKAVKKDKDAQAETEGLIELNLDSKQSFTAWIHSDKNYEEEDNSDKEAINAIVENFSEFNPMEGLFGEVERPKAEFFSPTKKAKESLDEEQLPVSETLAKIYALQGNYPRAIAAYEQLSLKFPEKKTFFANLIKDLKKQIQK